MAIVKLKVWSRVLQNVRIYKGAKQKRKKKIAIRGSKLERETQLTDTLCSVSNFIFYLPWLQLHNTAEVVIDVCSDD